MARAIQRDPFPALTCEEEMTLLSDHEIKERLIDHPGWSYREKMLVKKFELNEFMDVVALVNTVAPEAEVLDHHPDMLINYRRITFMLSSHDQGGVTEKDFFLLERIEHLANT